MLFKNFLSLRIITYSIGGGESLHQGIDLLVLLIMTFIAYSATFGTQLKKQIEFIQSTDKVYWWDIRISKEIFWIRFIFLFTNLILVGFTVYLLTKVTFFVMTRLSSF